MSIRKLIKRKQEQQGWPNTQSHRSPQRQEWDYTSDSDFLQCFLCRSVKITLTSFPRQSWRRK